MPADETFIAPVDLQQVSRRNGVTLRAFILGMCGAVFVAAYTPYNDYYLYNTFFVGNHLPVGIVFMMIFLTLVVNTLLKLVAEGRHFSPSELIVIWSMMAAAGCIPSSGLMRYFFNMMITPVERTRFDPVFQALTGGIPDRLLVTRDAQGKLVEGFLEGIEDAPWSLSIVPWRMWLPPILRWSIVIIAFLMLILCIGVIVRRQWVHNECLSFPLAQFTLELCKEAPKGRALNDFFRSGYTWLGASIPVLLFTLHGLKQYYPTVPAVKLNWSLQSLFANFPWDHASSHIKSGTLYISMVAIAMLLPTDVAFSLWFFFVASVLVDVLNASLGGPSMSTVRGAQSFGGFVFLVGSMIWIARSYLKRVLKTVPRTALLRPVDEELKGPARAVIGCVAFGAVAWVWLVRWGEMGWLFAGILLLCWIVMNLVMARAVTEAGLYHVEVPWWPIDVALYLFGVHVVGVKSAMMFVLFTVILLNDLREGLLPYFLNSNRMAEASTRIQRGRYFAATVAAILCAMVVGTVAHLVLHYKLGVHRFDGWGTYGTFRDTFGALSAETKHAQNTFKYIIHFFIGGGLTAFFAWMRLSYTWWPFHPLGFVLARSYPVEVFWMPIALGWLAKMLILRYGGAKVYYRIRPFIYGVILGECFMAGVWMVVGLCVYLSGHQPVRVRLLPG